MSRRSLRSLLPMFVVCLGVGIVGGAAVSSTVGIGVAVEPTLSDLQTVVVEIAWAESADEAFLALNAPGGVEAVVSGGSVLRAGDRLSLGTVAAGDAVTVEVFGLEEGQQAFLAAERAVGTERFQVVTTVDLRDLRRIHAESHSYRIYREPSIDSSINDADFRNGEAPTVSRPQSGMLVVESMTPKTAATLFGQDGSNVTIPMSPAADCEQATHHFSTIRQINVSGAPAGSLTTALAVHIIIQHPDMSNVQIGFTEDDYYWDNYPMGAILWWGDAGQVNLNRTWTKDKYNHDLPGIGKDPNGWFQIWLVNCDAGDQGILDYWSVEATYDVAADYDLIADSVSVDPDPAAPGDDIRVTWSGHIGGTDAIAGGFTSRIYLSTDSNITTADTVLATIAEAAASDPGDTFGSPAPGRSMTLPGGLADGTYYVGVIVDYNDAVDESNENNNTAWTALEISSSVDVDLVADSITPQSGSVDAGSSVAVNWFGHADAGNSGDISGDFTVGFYLSPDGNVTTADTLLDRATVAGPTTPGESFGANGRPLTIPGGTAAGTWYLGIVVDDTSAIDETDEGNNIATASITVNGGGGGGQADLVVSSVSVSPPSVASGGSTTVTWTEQNQGTEASGAETTRIYLSSNSSFDPGSDIQLRQVALGGLGAGTQRDVSRAVTIPAGTSDGTWYVIVVADADNGVSESNENNNTRSAVITVGSGGGGGVADHWLIPAAASANGYGGSDWRTQVSITNATSETRQATIYFVRDSAAWPGVLLSGPVSIGPRRSFYLDDILATLRPASGLLHVVLDEPGPVVTTRTYNRASDGSTFGQGIPGIPLIGGAAPDEMIVPMVHSGAGRFHTNLGLVQASTGSMTVEISIYTAGGTLLGTRQRILNDGWDQINDVFNWMGIGSAIVEGGWASVRVVAGSPDAWTCYASVVDDETGDPTYVAGVETP